MFYLKDSKIVCSILATFFIALFRLPLLGQVDVIDFTDLYSPSVTCYYGSFYNPFSSTGIINGRHTLINQQGTDPNTDNLLPFLPQGESKVIRLGNDQVGAEAEAIQYTFTVNHFKSILLLKFAVVFEDPQHSPSEQPRFVVRVLNSNGQLVEDCAEYDVTAAGHIPGFNSFGMVRWRPWTNVGIDLSPYIGKEVQVQFVTYDCKQSGHFGYAYFTASCIENHLSIVNCENLSITLTAPDDFVSYQWDNGDTSQSSDYYVTETYKDASCLITSATGCQFTLHAHITTEIDLPTEDVIVHDTICIGEEYHDNYFNIPQQNTLGDYIFLNTLFDLNNCTGDADIVLLLHVTDERPYFAKEIEGLQNVHVSTNMFSGTYNYRIEKIPRVNNYNWTLSNPKWLLFPNENECTVVVTTHETAVLTVNANNSCGDDSKSILLNANFYDVDEIWNSEEVNVFPNPTSNRIFIDCPNIKKISVFNLIGQKMKESVYNDINCLNFDLEGLSNGIYLLRIQHGSSVTQKQIMVSK